MKKKTEEKTQGSLTPHPDHKKGSQTINNGTGSQIILNNNDNEILQLKSELMRLESAPKPNMKTIRHASIDFGGTQDSIGGYDSSKSRPFNLEEIFENSDTSMVSTQFPKLKDVFAYLLDNIDR
jgi:hypothetical protein